MSNTFAQLNAALVKNYQLAPEALTLEATFNDLGMDSLDVAEMLFSAEDEFKVVFQAESEHLATVGDVVSRIDQLIAAQGDGDSLAGYGMAPILLTA